MYVEDVADPEGDLLTAIRSSLPLSIPVACALDMHGTITDAMIANANVLVGYRTAPHIDIVETGAKTAQLLVHSLREQRPLVTRRSYLPLLISGEQSETDELPMTELLPLLDEIESAQYVASASLFVGFPWADNPYGGVNALVVGDEESMDLIDDRAKWIADKVWERRADFKFTTEAWDLDEAIKEALEDPGQPVIISDAGDNPTAGAAQDLTIVVKELVENKVNNALVVAVVDPESVERCFQVNEGDIVQLNLGRSESRVDAAPYPVEATLVRCKSINHNRFAVIDKDGLVIIICTERFGVTDPSLLFQLGLEPAEFKIIVIKSGYISPEYQNIAARKIFALTDGDTNLQITELKYEQVRRPIYPLDKM
jgi:microcystin degradation protein MlrC